MRVAFMHRRLAGGGTEADLRRLAGGLAARGHEVHVFCARVDAELPGVAVHRVPIVRAGRLLRLLSFALAAPRTVARERWDVVLGFGRTPVQDVVRCGGGTHRSYLARMEADGLRPRLRGPYHRAILHLEGRALSARGHRRVLAVSARVRDEVVADYRVPRERVTVIYNGVDLERFHPARRASLGPAARQALGVPEDTRLCAAIGSGFRRKGFDLLLRLWADTPPPQTTLVLVGDDERLASWRRAAALLGANVLVTGPRADVEAVLAAADVVCVPSRQEAFGNVVLEACAAGVPVVTSRRAGAAELLDGPLRALVVDDPTDLPALGTALAHALADRDTLSREARAQVGGLTWDAHLDRVEAFLTETARELDPRGARP
jgi:UDP-glucose:(heptosyl)LPS alpha-1,3-glucosyltransferase